MIRAYTIEKIHETKRKALELHNILDRLVCLKELLQSGHEREEEINDMIASTLEDLREAEFQICSLKADYLDRFRKIESETVRQATILYTFGGFTKEEIASVLNMSQEDTVRFSTDAFTSVKKQQKEAAKMKAKASAGKTEDRKREDLSPGPNGSCDGGRGIAAGSATPTDICDPEPK